VRRWRNPLLLALLLVCAGSWWWAQREPASDRSPAPATPARPRPQAPGAAAEDPASTVHLAVLNGTGEPGLARRVSRRLGTRGCVVVRVADAPHDTFATTLLVNRRLAGRRAAALARRLGGVRVLREWDARAAEDAVLVLGDDRLAAALAGR
jgi:hypothetical protein